MHVNKGNDILPSQVLCIGSKFRFLAHTITCPKKVTNEIMPYVPTKYDESKRKFIELSNFIERNYSNFYFSKTRHMSIKKDVTKTPKIVNVCSFTTSLLIIVLKSINTCANRWEYFLPKHCDQNVVLYHATILLIWGAHLNI